MEKRPKTGTQAASSEVVRDIDRRIVLNLIRTHQPISRADLARVSEMQPSTISLIVEQLIGENWVLEREMGRLPRGRRACNGERSKESVSVPGRFNSSSDRLIFAPNLGWRDVEIDVEVENAANACALAAVWFDHGSPSRNLVAVTVSEGIGTGILSNGQLVRGKPQRP